VPINFHPGPGTILICDFSTGFQPPEMVKVRPVVIISPRRRGAQLVTVVPFSSTAPVPVQPWHWPVPPGVYPPARDAMWAKCDLVVTVGLARLDRVKIRLPNGQRSYQTFQLTAHQLQELQATVKHALGLA